MFPKKKLRTGTSPAPEKPVSDDIRRRYAAELLRLAGVDEPKLAAAFATVAREAFLPPPPWKVMPTRHMFGFSTRNPRRLYRNVLVAIDPARGINNGEPALHAAWLAAVAPKVGQTVCQIGAGGGYYAAILAELVGPTGRVEAFEIVPEIGRMAERNLAGRPNVAVHASDPADAQLPASDVIYVNAAVIAPPVQWLEALKPGGRLIFPWRPSSDLALTLLVTRMERGFAARPLMGAWFIPLAGAGAGAHPLHLPDRRQAAQIRSIVITRTRQPDASAVAIFDEVWFSSVPAD